MQVNSPLHSFPILQGEKIPLHLQIQYIIICSHLTHELEYKIMMEQEQHCSLCVAWYHNRTKKPALLHVDRWFPKAPLNSSYCFAMHVWQRRLLLFGHLMCHSKSAFVITTTTMCMSDQCNPVLGASSAGGLQRGEPRCSLYQRRKAWFGIESPFETSSDLKGNNCWCRFLEFSCNSGVVCDETKANKNAGMKLLAQSADAQSDGTTERSNASSKGVVRVCQEYFLHCLSIRSF